MEYNMKHNMTPVKYNEWLDTKIKIPFKKALAEIVYKRFEEAAQ